MFMARLLAGGQGGGGLSGFVKSGAMQTGVMTSTLHFYAAARYR